MEEGSVERRPFTLPSLRYRSEFLIRYPSPVLFITDYWRLFTGWSLEDPQPMETTALSEER
jgi:hypothetical protein